MKILAIETSCDETAAAVTEGTEILSSVKWTHEIHNQYGGVAPARAVRAHEERIEEIINDALKRSETSVQRLGAVAVTVGPGLAIALEVGIKWARKLAADWHKPLIGINHIEGHILSALKKEVTFPCQALVISGGHTQVIRVDGIVKYKLPLPMAGREGRAFSYSGLKTAFYRLVTQLHSYPVAQFEPQEISDLAAGYQAMVFRHLVRTLKVNVQNSMFNVHDLLVGGGVAANMKLRDEIKKLSNEVSLNVHYPANLMLCTDNAAMIGVAAGFKAKRGEFTDPERIDRLPRWRVDE